MCIAERSVGGPEGSLPSTIPLQVLILENDPADAELCLHELDRAGIAMRARVAQNRAEFEKAISAAVPDMVLADFRLPGWNGMAALESLRERGLHLPLILVSGALGDEAAVECIKQGATDYVLKNHLARLPLAVRRAVEERRLRDEQACVQAALRQEEERFRALIENSADGIVLIDTQGRILFTSHADNHIVGYTATEQLGKRVFDLIYPADRPGARAAFEGMTRRTGSRVCAELRYHVKTGGWVWLECIATNLLENPAVGGIVINYRDISAHKEAEQKIRVLNAELERRVAERTAQLKAANQELHAEIAERRHAERILRASQERFRLLVDGVRDYAVVLLDAAGCIRSWNPGAERVTGFQAQDVLGSHYACFFTPEDTNAGKPRLILDITSSDGRFEEESWRLKKDGSRYLASVLLAALFSEEGELRGFSHILRDVTERHRTQQALENLRLQRELILKAVGEGICGLDQNGHCVFFNPAAERMTGWKAEELIGRDIHAVDPLVPHLRADGSSYSIEECRIVMALAGGMTSRVDNELFRRKDGSLFPVEYISTPLRNLKGEIRGVVVSFRDVTERRAMEKMKDEFVSIVSHELRTPLTSIRGALGLLAAGLLDQNPAKRQHVLDIASAGTKRLTHILNDILDLERMQSGRAAMVRMECNAAQLLTEAADSMRVMSEKHEIRLELYSRPVIFRADLNRVMQVLINLLSNAIKFSPRGATVALRVQLEGGQVVFSVQDQGRGIPPNKLDAIFDRFCQVDASDSREKGGAGLGLAICRTIVTQHGGRIWVESQSGSGSIFYFSLPVGQSPAAAAGGTNAQAHSHH